MWGPLSWYSDFKGGGSQDFKGNSAYGTGYNQIAAGNFNFGASVAAMGWSVETAQALAGEGAFMSNVKVQVNWGIQVAISSAANGFGPSSPVVTIPTPPPTWNLGAGSPGNPAYAPNTGMMNQGDQDETNETQAVVLGFLWYSMGCSQ
jgi:hypothetical protein